MGENTKIEWATHTFNPWLGCTKVGPGCDHCYAEGMMANRLGRVGWGAGEDRKRTSAANWRAPLKWNAAAIASGRRDTVFCLSLGDIWDNEVDPLWRRQLFNVIESTPSLIWLLLSKRIGNAVDMCDPMKGGPALPQNCALGATMVNQDEWDRDAIKLNEACRRLDPLFSFASVEPMLGPIDARRCMPSWIICGGESGPHARPMHPDWARSLRNQCAAAGVAFHFKQWGETMPAADAARNRLVSKGDIEIAGKLIGGRVWCHEMPAGSHPNPTMIRVGKRAAGRLLDGIEHNGFPPVLTP